MAGIENRVKVRQGLMQFSRGVRDLVVQEAVDAGVQAGIDGHIAVQNHIATVPSSLSPGKVGRIDTGLMFDSIDSDVKKSGTKIIARTGWLRKKRKYFLTQEYGGHAFGKDITAMHALTAGLSAMEKTLADRGFK